MVSEFFRGVGRIFLPLASPKRPAGFLFLLIFSKKQSMVRKMANAQYSQLVAGIK